MQMVDLCGTICHYFTLDINQETSNVMSIPHLPSSVMPYCIVCYQSWIAQPCVYVDSFIIHQVHKVSLCNCVVWPVYAVVPFLKQRQLRAAVVHLLKASRYDVSVSLRRVTERARMNHPMSK